MSNPLISIVIPVYNVGDVLDRCLRSIVVQSYEHWEVILVDDASSDDSPTSCDQWAAKDGRIRALHQDHGGVSTARNRGVASARGDFLTFIDGDDFVEPDYLSLLIGAQQRTHADLVMSAAVCEDSDGHRKQTNDRWDFNDLPAECLLTGRKALSLLRRTIGVVLWAKLYARRIWPMLRFPDGRIHEDEYVLHHVYFACETVAVIHSATYHYVRARPSIMHAQYTLRRLDRLDAKIDRLAFYTRHHVDRELIQWEFTDFNKFLIWSRTLQWNAAENRPRFRELFRHYRSIPPTILLNLPLSSGINYVGTWLCPFVFWRLHEIIRR